MSRFLTEVAAKAIEERDEYRALLQQIAHGKEYQKRGVTKPIHGTEAQQLAREALVRRGILWSPVMMEREEK